VFFMNLAMVTPVISNLKCSYRFDRARF